MRESPATPSQLDVLYALIFILSGPTHFSSQTIAYAATAGVPLAGFLVPAAGVLAMTGGLSIALGYRARLGAYGLIAFLVSVTFAMHTFWAESDPSLLPRVAVHAEPR
jgi:putative oxidoreductase